MADNIYTFLLPDLGEGVVEGEVVEWLKKVGDPVKQDEPVVTVMTDKATVELPSPHPGTVHKHYYKPGEIAIKDKPLYDIQLEAGIQETVKEPTQKEPDQKTPAKSPTKPKTTEKASLKNKDGATKAIPKIRHEAKVWGLELSTISGTGEEGRITEEDLHHAQSQSKPFVSSPPEHLDGDQEYPLTGVRGLMAKKMHELNIPQFSYLEQADATRLIQLRQKIKDKALQEGINLSFMPFLIRALSLTIQKFPQLNASIDMEKKSAVLHHPHNIGIAMASSQGLIVPVLKGVEALGLREIAKAYEDLKEKAFHNKLASSDMKEATITISNFGGLEGEVMWATPMIMSPEVAILAVAKMRKIPVVKNDQIVIQEVVPLSWSFDHRLIDGEMGAEVSHFYSALVTNPAALL